jgi:hypothetical protein
MKAEGPKKILQHRCLQAGMCGGLHVAGDGKNTVPVAVLIVRKHICFPPFFLL